MKRRRKETVRETNEGAEKRKERRRKKKMPRRPLHIDRHDGYVFPLCKNAVKCIDGGACWMHVPDACGTNAPIIYLKGYL